MPKQHYTVETFEPINSIGFLIERCGSLLTQEQVESSSVR